MATLTVGQKVTKKIDVVCERKSFTRDGQTKEYYSYVAILNGIPVTIQVPLQDKTGRFLLDTYFES